MESQRDLTVVDVAGPVGPTARDLREAVFGDAVHVVTTRRGLQARRSFGILVSINPYRLVDIVTP